MNDEQPQTADTAPESLDDILKEFDVTTEDKPQTPAPDPNQVTRAEFDELKGQLAASEGKRAVDETVQTLKQRLDGVDVSEQFLNRQLHGIAATDPRFVQAYADRATKPDAWNKALDAVAGEMKGMFGTTPAPDVDADREAVRAAANVQPGAVPDTDDENAKAREMQKDDYFMQYQS